MNGDEKILSAINIQSALEENPFVKLGDVVFDLLEKAIMEVEILPGERINITQIAAELGVSVTTVRIAVEQLCSEGLISRQKKGEKNCLYYAFNIENGTLRSICEARRAIECASALICAKKNWTVDLPRLKALATKFKKSVQPSGFNKRIIDGSTADREFHNLIISSTQNEYILGMYETLNKKLNYLSIRARKIIEMDNVDNLLMINRQHVAIYTAIWLGFPEQAYTLMGEHIDFCTNALVGHHDLIKGTSKNSKIF